MPIPKVSKKNLNRMGMRPEGQPCLSFILNPLVRWLHPKTLAQDHGTTFYWLSVLCLLI